MSKKIVSVKSATKIFSEQFHDAVKKESSQECRTYKLGRGIITIDESAKEDFKKLMNWSESDWDLHTQLLMKTNEGKISSSQEDEQILKEFREQGRKSKLTLMRLVRQSERKKCESEISGYKMALEEYIKLNDEKRKQLKEARECIQALVDRYVCNRGGKHQFIACSTPKGTPEHWKKAISIVESIEQENTACPLNEKERNKA